MSKELDVSWFDLSKYDELASMDLNGWCYLLEVRQFIVSKVWENAGMDILPMIKELQEYPILMFNDNRRGFFSSRTLDALRVYPFNTYSVYSTPAIHVWQDREWEAESAENGNELFQKIWKQCEVFERHSTPEQDAPIYVPYDFLYQQTTNSFENGLQTNVTVDLTATDEQILSDFQHWLTEYRKATGYESNKNNFSDKDFDEWRKYQLLPYIDLTLSRDIEGKKITNAKIASLIFKETDDPVGALRTTKKKAEWLLRRKTLEAIEAQIGALKGN
ncbi:MAG: DUF6387 family protein [Methylococcales bacterium]|nr:DUF6387 family protein [Methylococcales bacterium]